MGDSTQSGPNWQQMLLTGVSAAIDSQIATPYQLNNPVYNTQYGVGGQGQSPYAGYGGSVTATAKASSPLIWIAAAALLFLLLRK